MDWKFGDVVRIKPGAKLSSLPVLRILVLGPSGNPSWAGSGNWFTGIVIAEDVNHNLGRVSDSWNGSVFEVDPELSA